MPARSKAMTPAMTPARNALAAITMVIIVSAPLDAVRIPWRHSSERRDSVKAQRLVSALIGHPRAI
jgi:hypothetical protein